MSNNQVGLNPEKCKETQENLERLLSEFFSPNTSNECKHEIERMLSSFSSQPGSWRYCMYLMTTSNNEHLPMFCLSTIETVITQKWLVLTSEERSELTSMLYKQTLLQYYHVPCYIRNKLMKLVVNIARYDWPHFYPDFLANIFGLIEVPRTLLLGIDFLRITSEELICPKEDLSVCRKDELKRLFTSHIPRIFNYLAVVLKSVKDNENQTETQPIVESSLETICHLFSWLPLQTVNHSILLSLVCYFATKPNHIGVLALTAINELLYKNFIPVSFLPYLVSLCNQGYQLLQTALNCDYNLLDDRYLSKVTELSNLCVSKHWHRLEQSKDSDFPVNEFLSTLYQYTFSQTSLSGFYECLETWTSLIEYIQSSNQNNRHEDVLLSLVQGILKKIQSEKSLDDEKTNDDNETERQEFLRLCIEVISKIAEIVPSETCSLVINAWEMSCSTYTQLLSRLESTKVVFQPDLSESLLYCAALTQAVGRLQTSLNTSPHICASLAGLTITATRTNIHYKLSDSSLANFVVNLEVQVLAALKTWLTLDGLDSAVEACLTLLLQTHPAKLQHSAAHLLAAVATLSTKYPMQVLVSVQRFFGAKLDHLQPETQIVVQCALCKCLLSSINVTEDKEKSLNLLCHLFTSMTPSGVKNLKQVTSVLIHCQAESKNARKLLCSAIMPVLEEVVKEFPLHLSDNPDICEQMLSFFLEAFRSLQDLVGPEVVQCAVETFIQAFTSVDVIQRECGIDKLLQLLVLIIEQAAPVFKQFIPSCVSLCLNHIYPALSNIPAPHIRPHLFHLLTSILLHKWHYFYRATVRDQEPLLEHENQLGAILQLFGESLTQTDISLFAQNLQALETLNQKWKLYFKDLFRTQFLAMYLMLLLNTLVSKTHALLADDIATAIYNMASVDFDTFYSSFIPHFLTQTLGLDSNQREVLKNNMKPVKDLPSFIQNVHRLSNDIRCYRLCNGTA